MAETIDFWQARKDFLVHRSYTKGYSPRTCYNDNSDLGVETDPVYLADKPKRPHRIPVWLEKKEQEALDGHETPGRSSREFFGRIREHTKGVRQRHDFLFGLILTSGLRIIDALILRAASLRIGLARASRRSSGSLSKMFILQALGLKWP